MGLFKKIGSALKKVIKPGGLLSKVVSKIPVIGGIASGAIDIVGGMVQKIGQGKQGTATKQTAGQSFIDAYQNTTGSTAGAALNASLGSGVPSSPFTKYILIGGGVLVFVLVLMFFKKRR